jgi:DNA-binding XRE family transcriptional regulator
LRRSEVSRIIFCHSSPATSLNQTWNIPQPVCPVHLSHCAVYQIGKGVLVILVNTLVLSCRFKTVNGFILGYMDSQKLRTGLGRVIRARRVFLGYSQETFADKVGIHRTYQGAIERGEQNVSLNNLVRIANALNMRMSELFADAEKALKPEARK